MSLYFSTVPHSELLWVAKHFFSQLDVTCSYRSLLKLQTVSLKQRQNGKASNSLLEKKILKVCK